MLPTRAVETLFGSHAMSGGYAKLSEEPPLRPPSREYIESYCRAQALARSPTSPRTTYGARPLAAAAERRGPRLFDAGPGDAADYAGFCAAMVHHHELRGLRDADELQQKKKRVHTLAYTLSLLALAQTTCAAVFAYTNLVDLGSGASDTAARITTAVVFGSGCIGGAGGLLRSRWALSAFFLSQIWALALVFAQWLRSQQLSARAVIFCHQHAAGASGHAAGCSTDVTQLISIVLTLGLVYASMFVSDVLAERLQDELESEDQLSLIRFGWLMHRKTLVGIQRFEDLIHTKFEELVVMGYLKPRPTPR